MKYPEKFVYKTYWQVQFYLSQCLAHVEARYKQKSVLTGSRRVLWFQPFSMQRLEF